MKSQEKPNELDGYFDAIRDSRKEFLFQQIKEEMNKVYSPKSYSYSTFNCHVPEAEYSRQ